MHNTVAFVARKLQKKQEEETKHKRAVVSEPVGGDSRDRTDRGSIIERFSEHRQPLAVHEHDPVHKLDVILLADIKNLFQVGCTHRSGLFGQHVLPLLCSSKNPFFPNAGWQRNVNGIDVRGCQKRIVVAERVRNPVRIGDRLSLDVIPAGKRGQRVKFGCCK